MSGQGETVTVVDTIKSRGRRGAAVRLVFARGDITVLPSDAAREDLIVISCAPDSYAPTANSVVGALERIGISVSELALDKQEDLRKTTFCWISKPLPESAPYRQLLCLETRFTDAASIVSNVFRSIIALAPDARRVIMPMLMAGSGGGQRDVLEGTVRAFHAWTRRGLMLEQLTVVAFRGAEDLAGPFLALKKHYGDASQDDAPGPRNPSKTVVAKFRDQREAVKQAKAEAPSTSSARRPTPPRGVVARFKDGRQAREQRRKEQREQEEQQTGERRFGVGAAARARRQQLLREVSTMHIADDDDDDEDKAKAAKPRKSSKAPPRPGTASLRGRAGLQLPEQAPALRLTVAISYAEADAPLFALCKTILTLDNPQLVVLELRGASKPRPDVDLEAAERAIEDADAVVALLTPDFLATAACLDHFNVALYMGEGLLVPVLARAAALPRYMTLVQYLDAQPGSFRRLFPACMAVLNAADPGAAAAQAEWKAAEEQRLQLTAEAALAFAEAQQRRAESSAKTYDVFISYSQRFARQAQAVAELLWHLLPGVRVFIDTVQLRVGGKWQKTLYDALDSSRTVLALLSPAYFSSKFCLDELAVAKLIHDEGRGQLFALRAVPFDLGACPAFLAALLRHGEPLCDGCERVVAALNAGAGAHKPRLLRSVAAATHARKTERLRDARAQLQALQSDPETAQAEARAAPTVALVAHVSDAHAARALSDAVSQADGFRGEVVPLLFGGKDELLASRSKEDEALLEQSALVLPLLSDAFVAEAGAMNALHTALLRNRQEARCLVAVVVGEPLDPEITPSFVRLLPAVALEQAQGGLAEVAAGIAAAAALAVLDKFDDDDVLPLHVT